MILMYNQSHPWKERKWSTQTGLSPHTYEVFVEDVLLVQMMFRDPVVNGPINISIGMTCFLTTFKFVQNVVCLLGYPLLPNKPSPKCIHLKQYNFSHFLGFTGQFSLGIVQAVTERWMGPESMNALLSRMYKMASSHACKVPQLACLEELRTS